jgi:hypothetical protein
MDYKKFLQLLERGESATVDYKRECHAFTQKGVSARGELAKDICAMANNGNVASYLVIGVGDDRKPKSVENRNLTDDNLQSFTKSAIFPPPKVKLRWESWTKVKPEHNAVKFVVIQVGPNPRQVFRLAQDFVESSSGLCLRRNEVWIRRGATSDLATPEEIVRMASGKAAQEDVDEERQLARTQFARLSHNEQTAQLDQVATQSWQEFGYELLSQKEWQLLKPHDLYRSAYRIPTYCKQVDGISLLIYSAHARATLTTQELVDLYASGAFRRTGAQWSELPEAIQRQKPGTVHAVRRIWLVPVVGSVPSGRITKKFTAARQIGKYLWFYYPTLPFHTSQPKPRPKASSSELLVLDDLRSVEDYRDALTQTVEEVERERTTIVMPTKMEN